jgi:threonine dehydratase
MQTLHVQSVRQTANWLADMALHSYNGVRPHIRETPLLRSPWLSSCGGVGCRVYLKLESEQHTGSFKVRGAVNKVRRMRFGGGGRGVDAAHA